MSSCVFCKIAKGEIPCYKVWEDQDFLAFLDIHPIKEGHTVIVPKSHQTYLFEMDDEIYSRYTLAAKTVAGILKKAFNPKTGKIGEIVYGLDIDHVHIHLVPIDKAGDLSFSNDRSATKEQLQSAHLKVHPQS